MKSMHTHLPSLQMESTGELRKASPAPAVGIPEGHPPLIPVLFCIIFIHGTTLLCQGQSRIKPCLGTGFLTHGKHNLQSPLFLVHKGSLSKLLQHPTNTPPYTQTLIIYYLILTHTHIYLHTHTHTHTYRHIHTHIHT